MQPGSSCRQPYIEFTQQAEVYIVLLVNQSCLFCCLPSLVTTENPQVALMNLQKSREDKHIQALTL